MFQEYTLTPGNNFIVFKRIAASFTPHLLALVIAVMIVKYTQPELVRISTRPFYGLIIIMFGLLISLFTQYVRAKNFRMISTDQFIQWNSGGKQVTVHYSDMVKLEKDGMGSLYIYTTSSRTTPVVILTRLLTNIDELEDYLSRFVPVQEMSKVPFMFRQDVRLSITFLYMLALLVNIFSMVVPILLASAVIFFIVVAYSFTVTMQFRKEISPWKSITIHFLLLALVLLKTAVFTIAATQY